MAYFGGLLTTWLPCGWLYLFVLVAAGTGGVVSALVVMAAFWVGTLPALTALVVGARSLSPRLRFALPFLASLLLILTGLYTATGRASADLSSIMPPAIDPQVNATSLIGLAEEPLPCCQEQPGPR
jgi:sulfite exporter TauE/SafE